MICILYVQEFQRGSHENIISQMLFKTSYLRKRIQRKLKSTMGYLSIHRFLRKNIITIIFCVVLSLALIYSYQLFLLRLMKNNKPIPSSRLKIPYVVVHFDLKGAPPNIRYLRSILRHLKDLEANAILMEYEDMFPYEGELKNFSSPFHYVKNDLLGFLHRAKDLKLEVIPLIQTFGHLEYALKLEEFRHLRENPFLPDALCPSKDGSLHLVREMVRQVIELHEYVAPLRHIHIGCDEVSQLNVCFDCLKRKLDKRSIYLQHLEFVVKTVQFSARNPNVTVLIWDDILRNFRITPEFSQKLNDFRKENRVQPVYWDYTESLKIMSHAHLHLYQKAFKTIWVASAYKGADGFEAVTPDLRKRLLNNLNWILFIEKYKSLYKFQGIILTGWSRYRHFMPICELLPVSLHSLTISLMLISRFKYGYHEYDSKNNYTLEDWNLAYGRYLRKEFHRLADCERHGAVRFRTECMLYSPEAGVLYEHATAFGELVNKHKDYILKFDLEAKRNFGYMDRHLIETFLAESHNMFVNIKLKAKLLKKVMRHFFDENVYNEYISYKTHSARKAQAKVYLVLQNETSVSSWTRGRHILNENL